MSALHSTPKVVHVVGGGTFSHLCNHLSLAAPAYGSAAEEIARLCREQSDSMEVKLHLTKMADRTSKIETSDDLLQLVMEIREDLQTKIVFFSPAVIDFDGEVYGITAGKYATRLKTTGPNGEALEYDMRLKPAKKMVDLFRNPPACLELTPRKDIFLVSFKTTCGASEHEQYLAGLNLLKKTSSNLVLANDTVTRVNMIITPEEERYGVTTDRKAALHELVEIAYLRSHLTFTRSTVVAGEPIPWSSELVPETLRTVVNHCIGHNAYKPFRGSTAGHFATKIGPTTFLTSRRKTNFNDLERVGMVMVETDGDDAIIAYGSKPSVGGQSQRIVFEDHPEYDCIVHFHCPIREGSAIPQVSQREYECGSHECGRNTSQGLARFGNLSAVYLKQHGPNIVFNRNINPQEVIDFIEANFDLTQKTGGYVADVADIQV
jgi:hypothetical protein